MAISLGGAEFTVAETSGGATLPIVRTGDLASTVVVDYQTVAGSAADGPDYGGVRGSVTFAAGEAEKLIPVTIVDDALPEG